MRCGSRRSFSLWSLVLLLVILLIGTTSRVEAKLKGSSASSVEAQADIPTNAALPSIVGSHPRQRQLKKGKENAPTSAPAPSPTESFITWILSPFGGFGGFLDWAFRAINGLP